MFHVLKLKLCSHKKITTTILAIKYIRAEKEEELIIKIIFLWAAYLFFLPPSLYSFLLHFIEIVVLLEPAFMFSDF